MAKLGYIQEGRVVKVSIVYTMNINGNSKPCRYLMMDISARSDRGTRLNSRYLVVRVVNKKLITFMDRLQPDALVRTRLYACGFRTIAECNRYTSPIECYEIVEMSEV